MQTLSSYQRLNQQFLAKSQQLQTLNGETQDRLSQNTPSVQFLFVWLLLLLFFLAVTCFSSHRTKLILSEYTLYVQSLCWLVA